MAFTGSTLDTTFSSKLYISPAQINFDNTGWQLKDLVSTGTTYYGYGQSSLDQTKPVWKIRKDSTVGKVTTITYASNGDGLFAYAWSGRTGLSYR
jgi:hypothetical protein